MLHSVGEHARWVESSNRVGASGELNLSEINCLALLLGVIVLIGMKYEL